MKIEHISFSQKLRRVLDAPFEKKGLFFWLLSPLLFLISIVFAIIAKLRREKGYAHFDTLNTPVPNLLKVICIGNILVGGTGKSPLVRLHAKNYLKENFVVAIAARGIHANPVVIDSLSYTQENIDKLSDENREHFEILRSEFPKNQFYIFQNKNRRQSLIEFIEKISNVQKQCVFILDDGLQHFACPRHENICVCDAKMNEISPPYTMPLGPYREGFGRESIEKILSSFEKRIWTHGNHPQNFNQDDIASYQLSFVQFNMSENNRFSFEKTHLQSIQIQKPLVIAGIAHPERFLDDLKNLSSQFSFADTYFLGDHGQLTKDCLEKMERSEMIFLTLKDFFRFCTNKTFLKLCATRKVYGCYPDYFISSKEGT